MIIIDIFHITDNIFASTFSEYGILTVWYNSCYITTLLCSSEFSNEIINILHDLVRE